MGDSGVESEQTSNSNEESVGSQPSANAEEENLCQSSLVEPEIVKEEPKLPSVKVNNMAALWEQKLKEKEREVAETTHLTWKTEKPRYLGWNKDNLHFKPKPMMLEPAVTYDDVMEEENTLDDCSSISDTEVDRQAESETQFEEELDDGISERLDGTEEEEANSSYETSSSEEETASYHGGPEVGSLRQMFEQLGGSRTDETGGLGAEYKEPMGRTGNRETLYQGAATAPELRKVLQQPPVPAPRKAVSIELQGAGRDNGEITSDDETYSETGNGDGHTFEDDIQCEDGKEDATTEDEEQGQWNERLDPEAGARRVGKLPGDRFQPFLANTHTMQQHQLNHKHHQELELEHSQDHSEK